MIYFRKRKLFHTHTPIRFLRDWQELHILRLAAAVFLSLSWRRNCLVHRSILPNFQLVAIHRWSFFLLLSFLKIKRYRIDTISLPGWTRSVIKQMSQMPAAFLTQYFCPMHAMAVIFFQFNIFLISISEAGPAAAGIKFGIRRE